MITVNSISGGKTSAYLMKHYPANINIFSLVRVEDKDSFNWFVKQEENTGNTFNSEAAYKDILRFGVQNQLFDEDFDDCDTGYCGI